MSERQGLRAPCGPVVAGCEGWRGGHGAGIQPALRDGGQQAVGIGPGLPMDDLPGLFAGAASLAPESVKEKTEQPQGAGDLDDNVLGFLLALQNDGGDE